MDNAISKITDTTTDAIKKASEIIHERLFSPMYFYFLIAWIITNWKFVYVFLFVEEETILRTQWMLKVDYLARMYQWDFSSCLHLVVIPAVSSFIFVWWLSVLSTKFYEKHEENQAEKRTVKRKVEYSEKVDEAKSQFEIRKLAFDPRVKYEDNKKFNESMDDNFEKITVAGISMLPSEVLYNTDYQAYKDFLEDFQNEVVNKEEDKK